MWKYRRAESSKPFNDAGSAWTRMIADTVQAEGRSALQDVLRLFPEKAEMKLVHMLSLLKNFKSKLSAGPQVWNGTDLRSDDYEWELRLSFVWRRIITKQHILTVPDRQGAWQSNYRTSDNPGRCCWQMLSGARRNSNTPSFEGLKFEKLFEFRTSQGIRVTLHLVFFNVIFAVEDIIWGRLV